MSNLDLTRPLRTKNKTSVRLVTIAPELTMPLVGIITYSDNPQDNFLAQWSAEGIYHPSQIPSCLDLENAP